MGSTFTENLARGLGRRSLCGIPRINGLVTTKPNAPVQIRQRLPVASNCAAARCTIAERVNNLMIDKVKFMCAAPPTGKPKESRLMISVKQYVRVGWLCV